MLVHDLVPGGYSVIIQCTPRRQYSLCCGILRADAPEWNVFQLRLDSRERKLLQEVSYKRGLRSQVKVCCF